MVTGENQIVVNLTRAELEIIRITVSFFRKVVDQVSVLCPCNEQDLENLIDKLNWGTDQQSLKENLSRNESSSAGKIIRRSPLESSFPAVDRFHSRDKGALQVQAPFRFSKEELRQLL